MRQENYFIKDGYVPQTSAETVEEAFGDYWNQDRVAAAHECQWYVYDKALALSRKHNLHSVADIGCGYPAKLAMFQEHNITVFDQQTTVDALAEKFPNYRWQSTDLAISPDKPLEKFDLVICSDVIEHLLDPNPLVERIREMTGSYAVISTPERDYRRGFNNMGSPKAEHVREWNSLEFRTYLEASGLKVVSQALYPQKPIPKFEFWATRLLKKRNMKYSSCQVAVCRPK